MFHKLFIVVKKVPYITKKKRLVAWYYPNHVGYHYAKRLKCYHDHFRRKFKINKKEETRQSNSIQPNVMEPHGRNGLHLGRVKHL